MHTKGKGMALIQTLERLLRNAGVLLVAMFVVATVHRIVLSRAELTHFKSQQAVLMNQARALPTGTATPNFVLWSEQRVRDYQESLAAHVAPAIGILRIAKIKVEVPILEGTGALSLNRGVGHISGTANPGEDGNVVIAGHRDGFFRSLKDISLGDAIEVATFQQTRTYIVNRLLVVDPTDVSVLQPHAPSSITLITCYPFHYIGGAPKRYIVQASLVDSVPVNRRVGPEMGSRAVSLSSASIP